MRRAVATSDAAAGLTHPQVHPCPPDRQAILAPVDDVRQLRQLDAVRVRASRAHPSQRLQQMHRARPSRAADPARLLALVAPDQGLTSSCTPEPSARATHSGTGEGYALTAAAHQMIAVSPVAAVAADAAAERDADAEVGVLPAGHLGPSLSAGDISCEYLPSADLAAAMSLSRGLRRGYNHPSEGEHERDPFAHGASVARCGSENRKSSMPRLPVTLLATTRGVRGVNRQQQCLRG